jgi:hypothetical protein
MRLRWVFLVRTFGFVWNIVEKVSSCLTVTKLSGVPGPSGICRKLEHLGKPKNKNLRNMKKSAVPTDLDQQHLAPLAEPKLQFHFGLIGGIPLPKETLVLIALKRLYAWREQIVQDVAFKFGPEFINEAQELTQALLIAEHLLDDAGVQTELNQVDKSDPANRYTFLQVAEDVLHSSQPIPATPERTELLAAVNKQFRPWIKSPKSAAAC